MRPRRRIREAVVATTSPPEDRPAAEGGEKGAVAPGAAVEDLPREDGKERHERESSRRSRGRRGRRGPAGPCASRRLRRPPSALRGCSLLRLRPRGGAGSRRARRRRRGTRARSAPCSRRRRAGGRRGRRSPGPTTRARLNWMELSAIAFGISSRGTSVGKSAWKAGRPERLREARRGTRARGSTRA